MFDFVNYSPVKGLMLTIEVLYQPVATLPHSQVLLIDKLDNEDKEIFFNITVLVHICEVFLS